MAQKPFGYIYGPEETKSKVGVSEDPAKQITMSIFADRASLRAQLRDDAIAAGLKVMVDNEFGALLADTDDTAQADATSTPSQLVLVDCPKMDAAAMAALSRLDTRAAQCGSQVIVSSSVTAIDDVFACMNLSAPQLLVDPSHADRAVALGEAVTRVGLPAQELSAEDRLAMLRLTEQVSQIARRLDGVKLDNRQYDGPGSAGDASRSLMAEVAPTGDNLFRFDPAPWRDPDAVRATQPVWHGPEKARAPAIRTLPRDTLPDPRVIRQIIRRRQLRGRFLDPELFADPAWDMLLDLTAAAAEHVRVSVSSLCIAASVPPTTALRWIRQMTDSGLLARIDDDQDKRRAFITLTDRARSAMASYFQELGDPLAVSA